MYFLFIYNLPRQFSVGVPGFFLCGRPIKVALVAIERTNFNFDLIELQALQRRVSRIVSYAIAAHLMGPCGALITPLGSQLDPRWMGSRSDLAPIPQIYPLIYLCIQNNRDEAHAHLPIIKCVNIAER